MTVAEATGGQKVEPETLRCPLHGHDVIEVLAPGNLDIDTSTPERLLHWLRVSWPGPNE